MKAMTVPFLPRTSASEWVLASTPASAKSGAFQPKLQILDGMTAMASLVCSIPKFVARSAATYHKLRKRGTKAGSARMDSSLRAHSEAKGEAIQKQQLDCFGPADLAMTRALESI